MASYTGRDIVDIRKKLIETIPNITDNWKDFNESDLGIIIIELLSGVADMQNFYLDSQAFETYLDTAVQDKNIRAILKTMNYRIPLKSSAEGDIVIRFLDTEAYKEIELPKYTEFKCSMNDIKFLSTDAVYKKGNIEYINVHLVQGELVKLSFSKKDLLNNVNSLGEVSCRLYLNDIDVADRFTEIIVNDEKWTEVEDALLEYNGGKKFSMHKDANNDVYILFTKDFLDYISEADIVNVNYIRTLGTKGHVNTADIDTIVGSSLGYGVSSITNPMPTYGASDDVNLENAKIIAKRKAKTLDRYITLEDYETAVLEEGFVSKCVVKDWKTPEYVSDPFTVKIWAVDWYGNSIFESNDTSSFRRRLEQKIREKGTAAVKVDFAPLDVVEFNINAKIRFNTVSTNEAVKIKDNLINEIKYMYGVDSIGFGCNIYYSDIISSIRGFSKYIKGVEIVVPEKDIIVSEIQYPKLVDVNIDIVE